MSRWRGAPAPPSLADLNKSFEVVWTVDVTPVTMGALLQFAVAARAPVVPLPSRCCRWKIC